MEGRPIGSRYRAERVLGRGASGEVFAGVDPDGNPVAIKILRSAFAADSDLALSFVRERSLLLGLRSPHLVRVRDLVVEGDTHAIVMDLVQGRDLRKVLQSGPVPLTTVAEWGAQICAGLDVVHRAGIVHRDIKPENVLLDEACTPPQVRLTDFGIARFVSGVTMTMEADLIGTPFYMSPEIWTGAPPRPPSDLYSVGVLLYELACGVPPFLGHMTVVARAHEVAIPGRPPGIPNSLWDLLHALLTKDAGARPPDAASVSSYLRSLVAPLRESGTAPRLEQPPPWAGVRTQKPRMPEPPTLIADTELRGAAAVPAAAPAPVHATGPRAASPPGPESPARRTPSRRAKRASVIAAVAIIPLLLAGVGWGLTRGDSNDPIAQATPSPQATTSAEPGGTNLSAARVVQLTPAPQATPVPPAGVNPQPGPACVPFQGAPTADSFLSREEHGRQCREDVKRVQRELGIEDDGYFGGDTEAAVLAYQSGDPCIDQPDGRVGPKTWASLINGETVCAVAQ